METVRTFENRYSRNELNPKVALKIMHLQHYKIDDVIHTIATKKFLTES
jgi:hypothetical protein